MKTTNSVIILDDPYTKDHKPSKEMQRDFEKIISKRLNSSNISIFIQPSLPFERALKNEQLTPAKFKAQYEGQWECSFSEEDNK